MKRMWSRNELKKIIKTLVESSEWSFEEDVTFNGLVNFKDDVGVDGDFSIDGALSVTGAINGESNPSVKPIYYHPISIASEAGDGSLESRIQIVILDNNSSSYNLTTLTNKLTELMDAGALINANGYIKVDDNLYPVYQFLKLSGEYRVYYHTGSIRGNALISTILTNTSPGFKLV